MADVALKASGITLGFVDRFSGFLIFTGTVSEVQAGMEHRMTNRMIMKADGSCLGRTVNSESNHFSKIKDIRNRRNDP